MAAISSSAEGEVAAKSGPSAGPSEAPRRAAAPIFPQTQKRSNRNGALAAELRYLDEQVLSERAAGHLLCIGFSNIFSYVSANDGPASLRVSFESHRLTDFSGPKRGRSLTQREPDWATGLRNCAVIETGNHDESTLFSASFRKQDA